MKNRSATLRGPALRKLLFVVIGWWTKTLAQVRVFLRISAQRQSSPQSVHKCHSERREESVLLFCILLGSADTVKDVSLSECRTLIAGMLLLLLLSKGSGVPSERVPVV